MASKTPTKHTTKRTAKRTANRSSGPAPKPRSRSKPTTDHLTPQPATIHHYRELAHFHYRSSRLAVAERAWRLTDTRPTVVGPHIHRRANKHTVAVLVRTMPHLNCRARAWALGDAYRHGPQRELAQRINHDIRTIARVVVRPQWRGRGLARRLVQHALDNAATPVTEALAAMGNIHPFFEQAGMTRWNIPPHPAAAELDEALQSLHIQRYELASNTHMIKRLRTLLPQHRRELKQHLKRFVQRAGARRRQPVTNASWRELIQRTRERFLTQPIYYSTIHTEPPHTRVCHR